MTEAERDWSDLSTSQGIAKIGGNHQRLEDRHGTVSIFEFSERAKPAAALISDFLASTV